MTKFLCISAKAQHGKDTSGEIIRNELFKRGFKSRIIHYADLLKFICKTYFDWDGNKDEKGRTLLQYVGTDVVRKQEPDYWVNFVMSLVDLFPDKWDFVIIPDCRFPNEIFTLKGSPYPTYHISVYRPDFDNGLTEEQKNHPSETALDGYVADYRLINTTLDSLTIQINQMLDKIIFGE